MRLTEAQKNRVENLLSQMTIDEKIGQMNQDSPSIVGGFDRQEIQSYLNLYAFILNPPSDKLEKIEKLLNMAFRICRKITD